MTDNFVPALPSADFPKEAFRRSVIQQEPAGTITPFDGTSNVLTFQIASFADTIVPWGSNVLLRDRQLRDFWKSEDMLAGAVYSVCARNSAFEWSIEAEDKTKTAITNMLNNAITSQVYGWIPFIMAFSQDLYSTDNGAFIELIRAENRPDSAVIGIAHLDSNRCHRTGNPQKPVIYFDRFGKWHSLNWWNVIPVTEMITPIEGKRGIQVCAVSRVLKLANLLKNIEIFKNEKVSGRFYKQLHFVGGVSRAEIKDIMARGQEGADNAGQSRFILPEIIASLDPEKPVSTATIDLAALPDNFDLDTELKWYITGLALGFGVDYQDFAPLASGGLGGGAQQSEMLHRKSRGKSSKVFMDMMENIFHYYGVLPKTAHFIYKDRDLGFELEEQRLSVQRSQARAISVRAGEIDPATSRKIALRQGDLTQEEFDEIPKDFIGIPSPNAPDNNIGSDLRDTSVGSIDADASKVDAALKAFKDRDWENASLYDETLYKFNNFLSTLEEGN